MAEQAREGDRVRVAYEGVVTTADQFGVVVLADDGKKSSPSIEALTVLRRKRFPVGSVINTWPRGGGPIIAVKTSGGGWFWAGDNTHSTVLDDEFVAARVAAGDHEVIYEPPTA